MIVPSSAPASTTESITTSSLFITTGPSACASARVAKLHPAFFQYAVAIGIEALKELLAVPFEGAEKHSDGERWQAEYGADFIDDGILLLHQLVELNDTHCVASRCIRFACIFGVVELVIV